MNADYTISMGTETIDQIENLGRNFFCGLKDFKYKGKIRKICY